MFALCALGGGGDVDSVLDSPDAEVVVDMLYRCDASLTKTGKGCVCVWKWGTWRIEWESNTQSKKRQRKDAWEWAEVKTE